MSRRPTPETDAAVIPLNGDYVVWHGFARRMECDRDEAREERDKLKQLLKADSENVDAYLGVCIERDEWKAKYIQQNKDLGCEQMDPNGTIWDHAQTLQRERDEAHKA